MPAPACRPDVQLRRLDRTFRCLRSGHRQLIQHEVSDGIIAPGYDADALEVLKGKKKGNYNIVAIDPAMSAAS